MSSQTSGQREERGGAGSRRRTAGAAAGIAAEVRRERNPVRKAGLILGPGFITGAADEDPSGIGTYAVAGASLGLQTLWTALFTFPLQAAIQNICARLALVSGRGLAGVLKNDYPRPVLYGAVLLLFVANTINVGADLTAIADAFRILVGVPALWLVVPVAAGIVALQVAGSYRLIASVFKWLTLALLAYVADALIVHPDLAAVLRATVVPNVAFDAAFLTTLVAILGTTISPYLFFWHTNEEIEEQIAMGRRTLRSRRRPRPAEVRYATLDTNVGMLFSNLVMFFIILAAGATLFPAGKTDIRTAADAAQALRPLAGDLSGILFALGMIGAGLLAVPILSGSAAYAVAEAFGWRSGLQTRWYRAKPFYGVIVVATAIGVVMSFLRIDPIAALFWTAVINGVVAPPLLALVMHAARDPKVMGERTIGPLLTVLGWIGTVAMFAALAGLAYASLRR